MAAGVQYYRPVKTIHKSFCLATLENLMKYWPGESYLVMKSTPRVPGKICRNLLSIDSRLNRIDPSTNIFPPNPDRGYRTKFEILLEELFPNSIE